MVAGVLLLTLVAGAFGQTTVIDVLTARRETTLLDLIQTAGLTSTLQTGGPFTIFAPSNLAFAYLGSQTLTQLKSDTTALANLLKYHVVGSNVSYSDLTINEKSLHSLQGSSIRVNYYQYNRHKAVEGHRVITNSLPASNGIVYIIDGVMMPPNGTIIDIVATNPNFVTLKAALESVGLADALSEGPYTLFAPNEAAFQRLGQDMIQKLLAAPDLLKSILLYHLVHGTLYSTGMHSEMLTTLEAHDFERLSASIHSPAHSSIQIDGARVVGKDISATNGVIHVIDHVMIPRSLQSQIASL